MFEQLNMTKKLKRQISKAVSIALSAAMLVTGLPAEVTGGVSRVKAAETPYSLNLASLTGYTDKKNVTGSLGTEDYFSVTGTVMARVSSNKVTSLETDKASNNGGGSIKFTVKENATATVTLEVSSNGTKETSYSDVVLKNTSGNVTANSFSGANDKCKHDGGGLYILYGTASSTLTYQNLAAGTYTITSPGNSTETNTKDRGVRVQNVTVVETTTGGGQTNPNPKPDVTGGDVTGGDVSGGDNTGDGSFDGSDKTWNFKEATEDKVIQGGSVKYEGLKVDATTGAFKIRTDNHTVQINKGTKVGIPVNGDCEITVVAYDANYAQEYTLNGETPDGATHTFTYEGPKKYVELEVTGKETYLYSISTKNISKTPVDPNAGKKQDVTVTLTAGNLVAATDTVVLLNTADASDEVEVANNTAKLTVGKSYIALVRDADGKEKANLTARIDGSRSFAVTSQTTSIKIVVTEPKKDENGDPEATRTVEYKGFTSGTPAEGSILPGTDKDTSGILYKTYVSSGVTYSSGVLRFRLGNVLWIPIQDDTTMVKYTQTCDSTSPNSRPVYIGKDGADSEYSVPMTSDASFVIIPDITDLVMTQNGQKYLPIQSGGDVKITNITLAEYNPVNTVVVSGTISDVSGKDITTIKFKNLDNDKAPIVSAAVDEDGKYTVELRRVNEEANYVASIPATLYKLNGENGANQFTLSGNGATATKNFTVVDKAVATVSGTVSGAKTIGDKNLGVTLIPDDAAAEPVSPTLTKEGDTYKFANVTLEQGASYTVELTNADDYEVKDKFTIAKASADALTITATEKTKKRVSGKFVTSDGKNTSVTKITFTNMDTPDYKYTFEVSGDGYDVDLRAAEYVTSAEGADGYDVFDHVSVKTENVENDVYLQQKVVDTTPVDYEATIKVGTGTGKKFAKIADAIDYIARMTRTDEQRVTIELDENATYKEQLVINTPNITIKGNGSKITWYYGVGFSYYSAKPSADGKSAYYDEAYAVDKYHKQVISQNPGHWGATVNLLTGAKGFAATDLTFENSLNYYVTDEELADGASANSSTAVTARAKGIDVFAKAAKERGCVLYIQADNTTYKDCNFLSEQDTLYTGDAEENSYFVDCKLEGNTDYICGDGNAVFDHCELSMYCNTPANAEETHTTASLIAANKEQAKHGYLFSDCTIVRAKYEGTMGTKDNYLDRAWGAGTAYFLNTEVETADMICEKAYQDMNAKVADATYYEYNTHTPNGNAVDMSKREPSKGKILTEAEANAVLMSEFFDDWKPLYYTGKMEVGTVTVKVTAPVADADVTTTPETTTPGVKDLSEITWYEGNATTAYTGKTFKAETTYRAVMTVAIKDGFEFVSTVKAVVAGADSVNAVLSADKKTVTITATFTTEKAGPKGTLYTLDLSNGLKKGVDYDGGFSVLEDMNVKSGKRTIAGTEYSPYLQGDNNVKLDTHGVPTEGAALKLVALADGILTVAATSNDVNKALHFVDSDDPAYKDYINGAQSGGGGDLYVLNVVKGHTYYLYGTGTKVQLCAVSVLYTGEIEAPGPGTDPDPGTGDGDDKPGTGDGDDGTGDGNDGSFDGWDRVANPRINKVDYSSSDGNDKVTVTVAANVGDNGGEKLVVIWKKDGATASQTKTSTAKQTRHTFEFTCDGPGKYDLTATLKRKGQTDKTTHKVVTINESGKVETTADRGFYVELLDSKATYTYTGSAIKPAIAVYNGDVLLTEGVDYTVKYSNNVKAVTSSTPAKKMPTITVTGKGKLTGKTTQTFTIAPKNLNEGLHNADKGVVVGGMLDGKLIVAETVAINPILVYKGVVLKAGAKKDFELTTHLNKNKPTTGDTGKKITIKGVNNYTGELELILDVRKKSDLQKVSSVKIKKGETYTYNGKKQDVKIDEVKAGKTTLKPIENYIIVYNGDKTSAGTQKFTVVGMGLYTGSKTASYKINPRRTTKLTCEVDNDLKVNGKLSFNYNSAGVTFNDAITVTDTELSKTLVLGKDYKVSYSNNKKVSTDKAPAKYTVTFLGNYKGSGALKNNFTINALDLSKLDTTEYPDERYPDERDGELYLKSADKAYTKAALYKSAPYVLVNGVALKTSDYTVKYYLDKDLKTEMKGKDKVELGAGETSKTVYVQITGKKNYSGSVKTSFDVVSTTNKTDISKVTITPQGKDGKKQGSVPYTGKAAYPAKIEIKQGKNILATLTPDANGNWSTNDYEVTFVNNIEKGKATVIVTGTGKNVGSKTATYNVASRNLQKDESATSFWADFMKSLKVLAQ